MFVSAQQILFLLMHIIMRKEKDKLSCVFLELEVFQ